jgi:hypothetical protein
MSATTLIPTQRIERRILLLRGEKVMLDGDLAELYGVPTKVLNQAVRRNLERFPDDFMFRLSWKETELVSRSQIVTLDTEKPQKASANRGNPRSQFVTLESGTNLKYRPYAFTEQGVAMLSSVLRSPRAVQVNIAIMRAFVQLRQMLASHADLARKFKALEKKYDGQFKLVFDAIHQLMERPDPIQPEHGRQIGFHYAPPPSKKQMTRKKRKQLS